MHAYTKGAVKMQIDANKAKEIIDHTLSYEIPN